MKTWIKRQLLFFCLAAIPTAILSGGQTAPLMTPPAGTSVAIVLFQDLQWPECASAYPIVREAARAHNIPLVLRDFPLPRHNWSFEAAVNARYFALQSQQLGDEFRGYMLQNQSRISDESELRSFTERFAEERQLRLPAIIDGEGKLAESVHQDFLLGQRLGLEHTPTVFVVGNGAVSAALVGPVNHERLNRMIEQFQTNIKPVVTSAKTPSRTRSNRR